MWSWLWGATEPSDPDLERVDPRDIGPWSRGECQGVARGDFPPPLFFKKLNTHWLRRLADPCDALASRCCAGGTLDADAGGLTLAMHALLLYSGANAALVGPALRVLVGLASNPSFGSSSSSTAVCGPGAFAAANTCISQCTRLLWASRTSFPATEPLDNNKKRLSFLSASKQAPEPTDPHALVLTQAKVDDIALLSAVYTLLASIAIASSDASSSRHMPAPPPQESSDVPLWCANLDWCCRVVCQAASNNTLVPPPLDAAVAVVGAGGAHGQPRRPPTKLHHTTDVKGAVSTCIAANTQRIAAFLRATASSQHRLATVDGDAANATTVAATFFIGHHPIPPTLVESMRGASWAVVRIAGPSIRSNDWAPMLSAVFDSVVVGPSAAHSHVPRQAHEERVDADLKQQFSQTLSGLSAGECRALSRDDGGGTASKAESNTNVAGLVSDASSEISYRSAAWCLSGLLVDAFYERWIACTPPTFDRLLNGIEERLQNVTTPTLVGGTYVRAALTAVHAAFATNAASLRGGPCVPSLLKTLGHVLGACERDWQHVAQSPMALDVLTGYAMVLHEAVQAVVDLVMLVRADDHLNSPSHSVAEAAGPVYSALTWRAWRLLEGVVGQLEAALAGGITSATEADRIAHDECASALARLIWADARHLQQHLRLPMQPQQAQGGQSSKGDTTGKRADPSNAVDRHLPSALWLTALGKPRDASECYEGNAMTEGLCVKGLLIADALPCNPPHGGVLSSEDRAMLWNVGVVALWRHSFSMVRKAASGIAASQASQAVGGLFSTAPCADRRNQKTMALLVDRFRAFVVSLLPFVGMSTQDAAEDNQSVPSPLEGNPSASSVDTRHFASVFLTAALDAADVGATIVAQQQRVSKWVVNAVNDMFVFVVDALSTSLALPQMFGGMSTEHVRALAKLYHVGLGWITDCAYVARLRGLAQLALAVPEIRLQWFERFDVRMMTFYNRRERAVVMELVRLLYGAASTRRRSCSAADRSVSSDRSSSEWHHAVRSTTSLVLRNVLAVVVSFLYPAPPVQMFLENGSSAGSEWLASVAQRIK